MGNWRTVNITGTISDEHVIILHLILDRARAGGRYMWNDISCLSYDTRNPSIAGLGEWPNPVVDAVGNLAERDYSVEEVTQAFQLLLDPAPSMQLQVHCGGDYESTDCVATLLVGAGAVIINDPQIEKIRTIPTEQMNVHMFKALYPKDDYLDTPFGSPSYESRWPSGWDL